MASNDKVVISLGYPSNWEIRMTVEEFARFFNAPKPTLEQISEVRQMLLASKGKTVAFERNGCGWLYKDGDSKARR